MAVPRFGIGEGVNMVTQPFGTGPSQLAHVQEGMTVTDQRGTNVGKVKQVYLGRQVRSAAGLEPEGQLAEVPAALRGQLAAGFVEVETRFLTADRYVAGAQLGAVDTAGLHLAVSKEELIKK